MLGLGTWQLTEHTAETVAAAILLGYRMIDTARDYGTQTEIAESVRRSGAKRSDLHLVTKVVGTDDAYEATRANLRELKTDYADLVLIHRPPSGGAGEELWRGLIQARANNLTKDIGVSNYSSGLIDALLDATGELPTIKSD